MVVIAFWDFEVVVMSYLGPGMVVIAFLDFEVVVMSYCPDEMVVIAFPHGTHPQHCKYVTESCDVLAARVCYYTWQ